MGLKPLLSILAYCIIWFSVCSCMAQSHPSFENDSLFIKNYAKALTLRLYTSQKTTKLSFADKSLRQELNYRPNDRYILGVGFNYKWLGINIGFNLPYINKDDTRYGTTQYLDLQTHLYLKNQTADIYLQNYEGYYLSNPYGHLAGWPDVDSFPHRPDIHTRVAGINWNYVINSDRFSYRAAFVQNEWQKKSSGSLLVGCGLYFVHTHADSSFIPHTIIDPDFFDQSQPYRANLSSVAGNLGYAHTFVYKQHWFLSLSLSLSLGLGNISILDEDPAKSENLLVSNINATEKIAFGFNSRSYFAGFSVVGLNLASPTSTPQGGIQFSSAHIRLSVCHRLFLKRDYQLEPWKW